MKAAEVRELTVDDLRAREKELDDQLFRLRIQKSMGQLEAPAKVAGVRRDLARINRRLGGVRLTTRAIDTLAPGSAPIAVLDVGTGGADIPLALIGRGRAAGRLVTVTGFDVRPEVLAAAALADPRITATGELALHVADGRALPFSDGAFAVAHASLLIHHLTPEDARELLVEMGRVARLGVVLNGLVRGRRAWAGWSSCSRSTCTPISACVSSSRRNSPTLP